MTKDIENRLFDYLSKMSYNGLATSSRIDLFQEYINFVNYLGLINYFSDDEVQSLIRIARNLANTFGIFEYLNFDAFSSSPIGSIKL